MNSLWIQRSTAFENNPGCLAPGHLQDGSAILPGNSRSQISSAIDTISAVSMMFVGYIPNQTTVKRTRDDRIADTIRVVVALLTGAAGWYVLRHETKWEIGPYQVVAVILMAVTAAAIFAPMKWGSQHQDGQNEKQDRPDGKGQ